MNESQLSNSEAGNDLAAQVAEELRLEHEGSIEDPEKFLDEGNNLEFEARKSIFQKITYKWHNSDQLILQQIEAGSRSLFEREFEDVITLIDNFYRMMRVPTGRLDEHQRPIWEVRDGKYVEDWSQVTGQDIDETLLKLQRIQFMLQPKVNKLLLEAVYAKYVFNDKKDDAWDKIIQGTQLDREAKSSQVARQDKYQAFFRYYLFRSADTFSKEIDSFEALLKKMRDWGIWSQER